MTESIVIKNLKWLHKCVNIFCLSWHFSFSPQCGYSMAAQHCSTITSPLMLLTSLCFGCLSSQDGPRSHFSHGRGSVWWKGGHLVSGNNLHWIRYSRYCILSDSHHTSVLTSCCIAHLSHASLSLIISLFFTPDFLTCSREEASIVQHECNECLIPYSTEWESHAAV